MSICTGDGRVIVGGTISIPNGSTVGVNTTVDEYGGGVASASTVSISGGTPTFAGKNIIGGTLLLGENATLANGTEIIGVGSGAEITGTTNTRFLRLRSADIKNITCRCCCVTYSTTSTTINLTGITITEARENYGVINGTGSNTSINLTNCKITGCTGSFARIQCNGAGTSVTLDGCEIENRVVLHHDSQMKYIYLKNKNKLGAIGAISTSDTRCRGRIRFYANSITEFSSSVSLAKVLEFTTNSDASASVGTLTNGEWVEGGTCAVILSGTTHHISGRGTFINKNGTGEWTDFTIID